MVSKTIYKLFLTIVISLGMAAESKGQQTNDSSVEVPGAAGAFDGQRLKELQSINYRVSLVRETCIVYLVFAAVGFLLLSIILVQVICLMITMCCVSKKATDKVNDTTKRVEEGLDELKAEAKDGRLKKRVSDAADSVKKSRSGSLEAVKSRA